MNEISLLKAFRGLRAGLYPGDDDGGNGIGKPEGGALFRSEIANGNAERFSDGLAIGGDIGTELESVRVRLGDGFNL